MVMITVSIALFDYIEFDGDDDDNENCILNSRDVFYSFVSIYLWFNIFFLLTGLRRSGEGNHKIKLNNSR